VPVRWLNDGEHSSDDGTYAFPAREFNIGALRVWRAGQERSSLDAVFLDGDTVEIRLPWTLLQFADPSQLHVIHDDRSTPDREVLVSEGIAMSVSIGGNLAETGRFAWAPWDEAPETTEREKLALPIFADMVSALPYFMN
jgi:hypothetical protein